MRLGMTGELHMEGQFGIFQIVVAFITGRVNRDANTLSRVQERYIFWSIYQFQGVRPLRLNNGFAKYDDRRLNFWRGWLLRRISRVLRPKGWHSPYQR